jgi:hypothetical protein
VPLAAVNVAVAEPAATVAATGTVSAAALLDRLTLAPPAGAAWFNVTVQALEEFCASEVGLQLSEEIPIDAAKVILAVLETPFRVAVSVAV